MKNRIPGKRRDDEEKTRLRKVAETAAELVNAIREGRGDDAVDMLVEMYRLSDRPATREEVKCLLARASGQMSAA